MIEKIRDTVETIDSIIRKEKWFDLHVAEYDGYSLSIVGGIDLSYFHTLEVIFEDVFFFSGFVNGWHSDTSSNVFIMPENKIELNRKFEIQQGYHLFAFIPEDYTNKIFIASKNISFNASKVYY